jgi:hypothetical protein
VIYVILHLDAGNYVNTCASEMEALADVRGVTERFGRDEVAAWALSYWDDAGELHAVAEGDDLNDRACGSVSSRH